MAWANVYTPAEWIDRAEAERMLDTYLAVLGLRDVIYKWRRPEIVAVPVTLYSGAV